MSARVVRTRAVGYPDRPQSTWVPMCFLPGEVMPAESPIVILPAADFDALQERLKLAEEALIALDNAAGYCQCEGGACEHSPVLLPAELLRRALCTKR